MVHKPKNMKMTLRTARELAGLTQIKAAKSLGISVDTLSNYEQGKSYPNILMLRKIEGLYGVTYNQLIFLPLDCGLTI